MTDTAQPFPEDDGPSVLTDAMQQRAAALAVARQTLGSRGLFSGSNVTGWTVDDLLKVADWILDGPADWLASTTGVLEEVPTPAEGAQAVGVIPDVAQNPWDGLIPSEPVADPTWEPGPADSTDEPPLDDDPRAK